MPVEIPSRLLSKLREDPILAAKVGQSLSLFGPWLDEGMPLFPYFTDHTSKHLTRVLNLAETLIRVRIHLDEESDAWDKFSSSDAACLILATILHDAAMHLAPDGFLAMVHPDAPWQPIAPFDTDGWNALWLDFLAEAKRWNDKQRRRIFGRISFPPVRARRDITDVPIDVQSWDQFDNLLAGEFVRRHHHRIAHEIARWGVPGPSEERIRIDQPENFPDIVDLAGLVARSHGMPLRATFQYFLGDNIKYRREFKGCHVVYLMVLLRIADYLDLYAERASDPIRLVRRLHSRYSEQEWDAHRAIDDIRLGKDGDPEAIIVDASPRTVTDFLKIRSWLDSIQGEIDQSWAVLGEVYGENRGYQRLGLSIRRIKSNLDNLDALSQSSKTTFIPRKARIEASPGGELLGLLIAPLYGDRPDIGIRELVQNGVDAVYELRAWCQLHSQNRNRLDLAVPDCNSDVLVAICSRDPTNPAYQHAVPEDWEYWVEVADRGIGMTAETIANYFLIVGASYRNDPIWTKQFVNKDNRVTIPRSGRFGIGVMASFLLGDLIRVSTRHVSAPADGGIAFDVALDSDNIQLNRIKRPIGTTVWVRISDETFRWLSDAGKEESERGASWSWYRAADPIVNRLIRPSRTVLPAQGQLPARIEPFGPWREFKSHGFSFVRWRFENNPTLNCNGFCIGSHPGQRWSDRGSLGSLHGLDFTPPSVWVRDPEAILPLDVKRFALTERLPFNDRLLREMILNYCAAFLLRAPTLPISTSLTQAKKWKLDGIDVSRGYWPWIYTVDGILPSIANNIRQARIRKLYVGSSRVTQGRRSRR